MIKLEIAYVLVQCKIAHEMEVLKALLEIDIVKEAKGTFGYYAVSYTHLTLPTKA